MSQTMGNGAYVLDTWEPGTRIVLKANPSFGDQPYFNRVELHLFRNPQQAGHVEHGRC